jgi:hypothetical protein
MSRLNRSRSGSDGVGMKVRPRSRTLRSNGDNWKVERLVTLERETGGNDNATGDPTINPVGSTSPSSSISPSPESSGCCHE